MKAFSIAGAAVAAIMFSGLATGYPSGFSNTDVDVDVDHNSNSTSTSVPGVVVAPVVLTGTAKMEPHTTATLIERDDTLSGLIGALARVFNHNHTHAREMEVHPKPKSKSKAKLKSKSKSKSKSEGTNTDTDTNTNTGGGGENKKKKRDINNDTNDPNDTNDADTDAAAQLRDDYVQDLHKDWHKIYKFFIADVTGPLLNPLPANLPITDAENAVEVSSLNGVSDAAATPAAPALKSMVARDVTGDGEYKQEAEAEAEAEDAHYDEEYEEHDETDEDDGDDYEQEDYQDDDYVDDQNVYDEFNMQGPPEGAKVLWISTKMKPPSVKAMIDLLRNVDKSPVGPDGVPDILLNPPVLSEPEAEAEVEATMMKKAR